MSSSPKSPKLTLLTSSLVLVLVLCLTIALHRPTSRALAPVITTTTLAPNSELIKLPSRAHTIWKKKIFQNHSLILATPGTKIRFFVTSSNPKIANFGFIEVSANHYAPAIVALRVGHTHIVVKYLSKRITIDLQVVSDPPVTQMQPKKSTASTR